MLTVTWNVRCATAALLEAGLPLAVDVPEGVATSVLDLTPGAQALHPGLLRDHLRAAAKQRRSLQVCAGQMTSPARPQVAVQASEQDHSPSRPARCIQSGLLVAP